MVATNTDRTLQSGYAELMGLTTNIKPQTISPRESVNAIRYTPFKIRNAVQISESLGGEVFPNAFVTLP